jgi:hypothetical protein
MDLDIKTILITIIVLLLGLIMFNFKNLFAKKTDQRDTITDVEKQLIQAIHDDNLNKFKVLMDENNISPDRMLYVSFLFNLDF